MLGNQYQGDNTVQTTKNKRPYTSAQDGTVFRADKNAYVQNKSLTTQPDRGNTPETPVKPKNDYEDRGGGRNNNGGGGVDYSALYNSLQSSNISDREKLLQGQIDDILNKIKSELTEQETRASDYYKGLYTSALANSLQAKKESERAAEAQYFNTENRYKEMYGGNVSGAGLMNLTKNMSDRTNNFANIQRDYDARNSDYLNQYNNNLSNAAGTMANMWSQHVMPIYTNRQNNLDEQLQQLQMYDMQLQNKLLQAQLGLL